MAELLKLFGLDSMNRYPLQQDMKHPSARRPVLLLWLQPRRLKIRVPHLQGHPALFRTA